MTVQEIPCHRSNYGSIRGTVEYLVIHYTAVPGDTAANNGNYFARQRTGTSAHYFVDENTVVRSVPEEYAAWHCGANYYKHTHCRNSNSIGIEICTKGEPGAYRFSPKAVERAQALVRQLMEKYRIPVQNVVRHYDVTGKICPAPFVGAGQAAWEEFKGGLVLYKTLEEVPSWAQPTVQKLVDKGVLMGDGQALDLTTDLTRTLVILDRVGALDKEEAYDK